MLQAHSRPMLSAILLLLVAATAAFATSPNAVAATSSTSARSLGGTIVPIAPEELDCNTQCTFEDITGGPPPGTNYDTNLQTHGAALAELFVGLQVAFSGDNDVLIGSPAGPLTLRNGAPSRNLNVVYYPPTASQIVTGLGPVGFPSGAAIGEGALSLLYDWDQSEVGFLLGGHGGNAFVSFYRRDGSLIDSVVLSNLTTTSTFAFRRAGGESDIAGFAFYNNDDTGAGLDNLCHTVYVVGTEERSWGMVKRLYD